MFQKMLQGGGGGSGLNYKSVGMYSCPQGWVYITLLDENSFQAEGTSGIISNEYMKLSYKNVTILKSGKYRIVRTDINNTDHVTEKTYQANDIILNERDTFNSYTIFAL